MGHQYLWWGGTWIFPVIMLVVMLVVVYLAFGRGGFRPPCLGPEKYDGEGRDQETAVDILKKRYAKGEITKEELEQMKNNILEV
jgi:putative membrane protein